jgi:hypothetical protein
VTKLTRTSLRSTGAGTIAPPPDRPPGEADIIIGRSDRPSSIDRPESQEMAPAMSPSCGQQPLRRLRRPEQVELPRAAQPRAREWGAIKVNGSANNNPLKRNGDVDQQPQRRLEPVGLLGAARRRFARA